MNTASQLKTELEPPPEIWWLLISLTTRTTSDTGVMPWISHYHKSLGINIVVTNFPTLWRHQFHQNIPAVTATYTNAAACAVLGTYICFSRTSWDSWISYWLAIVRRSRSMPSMGRHFPHYQHFQTVCRSTELPIQPVLGALYPRGKGLER
jgi:hypothetical protein